MNFPSSHVALNCRRQILVWTFRRSCTRLLRVKKVAHARHPKTLPIPTFDSAFRAVYGHFPGALPTRIRSGLDVNQTGGRPRSPGGNFSCLAGLFLSPQATPGGNAKSRAGLSRKEPAGAQTNPSRSVHLLG